MGELAVSKSVSTIILKIISEIHVISVSFPSRRIEFLF